MAKGTVKWFDPKKGFGFIINDQGQDVFVHYTSLDGDGFRCLRNGQSVEYEQFDSGKGLQGRDVQIISVKPSAGATKEGKQTKVESKK
jgi:CspA family cold shock protein